ncbi:hypothetical protein RISK_004081 [Rhodopirellula islandica]|uniref:Uncharacterized protein n=1 Tax=Rhodopirellula islandica TaxID=595434 RepID=A0A0J1EDQ1_RHOIS|nr:hypothetical protein RISK_004081 [Rhodopirellula islandica]
MPPQHPNHPKIPTNNKLAPHTNRANRRAAHKISHASRPTRSCASST